jgi:hypothetical protein
MVCAPRQNGVSLSYSEKLELHGMPSLNWIGKSAVAAHHKQVPFRLLQCPADLFASGPQAGNLEALKALLPYYAGQVKCIYIDHPTIQGMKNGFTISQLLK